MSTTLASRPRCPRCGWVAAAGLAWQCAPDGCGALFDTFETHGRCPTCGARWPATKCPVCERWWPHEDWYGAVSA